MKRILVLTFGFVLALAILPRPMMSAEGKPLFLYSRCFTALGDNRYSADGAFKEVLHLLENDFEVRVNDKPLTAENLEGFSLVLVANPDDKAVANNPPPHHVNARDIAEISRFVQGGGGFIVMGNQENHNLEITDMNKLLAHWGIQYTNL